MRAAILQMRSGVDPAANARSLVQAIADAKAGGADILFTPEMSNLLDRDRARSEAHLRAEDEDETLAAVRDAAREAGLWVHLGSLASPAMTICPNTFSDVRKFRAPQLLGAHDTFARRSSAESSGRPFASRATNSAKAQR